MTLYMSVYDGKKLYPEKCITSANTESRVVAHNNLWRFDMIQTQHLNTRLSFWQYLIAPLVSYFLLRLILMDLEITCRYQGAHIQHCSPYSPKLHK